MEELVTIFQLLDSNADIPYPVTILNRRPKIKWSVVWYDSRKGTKKACIMYLNEIGLRAQNMLIIPGSPVNMILGGTYLHDHLMNTRIFTLIMNERYSCEHQKL